MVQPTCCHALTKVKMILSTVFCLLPYIHTALSVTVYWNRTKQRMLETLSVYSESTTSQFPARLLSSKSSVHYHQIFTSSILISNLTAKVVAPKVVLLQVYT